MTMGLPIDVGAAVAKAVDAPAPASEVAASAASAGNPVEADYTTLIDKLTKGEFGNTDAAHNGNEQDKSTPMGEPASFAGNAPDVAATEVNVDGADKRVRASVERSRGSATPPPPTNLNKAKDEDKDDDDDDERDERDERSVRKSQDEISDEDIYNELLEGDGSEEFVPVAEASAAIQYLTDTMSKAISHLSTQVAAMSFELHGRVEGIEKSQAVLREATAALLKSQAGAAPMAKSMLAPAPASGVTVILPKADDKPKAEAPTAFAKSVTVAANEGRIDPEEAGKILLSLGSKDPATVWNNLSEKTRAKITGTKE